MQILSFILGLIPSPYLWIFKIVAAVILAGALVFSGYKLAASHYSPLLEKVDLELEICTSNYTHLTELTEKQNRSVRELTSVAEEKAKEVKLAQQKAKQLSKVSTLQAQDIMRLQLGNKDACQAASSLIDSELAKERSNEN